MLGAAEAGTNVPQNASQPDSACHFGAIPTSSLRVKRGHSPFQAGNAFSSIYSVRFGSFKTFAGDKEGRQQVTGFAFPGDVLGLDGIASSRHSVTAVALEDSELIRLPFASVERAARDDGAVQRELHALMSRQIVHGQGVMMMLGSLSASERVAAFLMKLSGRYQRLGYSAGEFHLRMTRADIASYLGMKIETVSRTLTAFAEAGLIDVDAKHMRLLDLPALESVWKGNGQPDLEAQPRPQRLIDQARMLRADARSTRARSATAKGLSLLIRRQGQEPGA